MDNKLIALLTDFGLSDPYVGIMKGVISGISPGRTMIDLTHQIPPGDIQAGAFHLWQSSRYFHPETVFLAVVDPGVGSARKGLVMQRESQIFIGPDNGLFSYLCYKTETSAWELANPIYQLENPSSTFHGRDIFAPAAAHTALGIQAESFGMSISSPVQLPQPILRVEGKSIQGEVIHSDQFGNLITSLGQFEERDQGLQFTSWIDNQNQILSWGPALTIDQTGTALPLVSTFSDIPSGSCAALIGSSGLLEIVSNRASAAELLKLGRGDPVTLNWN